MYMVYAIKSLSSDRIYVGQTNDVLRRLKEHNNGLVRSTKMGRPWELIAIQEVNDRNEARWTEKRLKNSHENRFRWIENHRLKLKEECCRASRSESAVSE